MTLDTTSSSARSRPASDPSTPGPRAGAAVCYDGQKVLLFGGEGSGEDGKKKILADTWTFDTINGWVKLDIHDGPSPRAYAGMAYDGIGKRAILFGGRNNGTDYGDTWAFDPSAEKPTWEKLDPANSPPARSSFGMAFDGKYVVLFGGLHDGYAQGGSWIFHGKEWESVSYPKELFDRALPGMSMDIDGEQAMLFGGLGKDPVPYADTWFYTSTNPPGWTNFVPATSPPLRERTAMVEGSFLTNYQFVLFGGYRGYDKTYYGDTWGYRDTTAGGTWEQVDTPTAPSPRADHAMALVTGSGVIVLFGGKNANGLLGDTWIYDNSWTQWTPSRR
jgi:hypothetical protein